MDEILWSKSIRYFGNIPTKPSNFETLKLVKKVNFKKIDIRNFDAMKKAIKNFKPDFVFHLAAQAL